MPHKTFIFFILVCCFLLAAPALILYSQGYRFDFDSFTLVQTGGLFVKTNQGNALIVLDGKKYDITSRFLGTKFIQNLLPKEYTLEISKAGLAPWKKKIVIREKQTTEFRNILLIPEKPKEELIEKSIETFFADNEKNLLAAVSRPPEARLAFSGPPEAQSISFIRINLPNPEINDTFTFRGNLPPSFKNPIVIDDATPDGKILLHSASYNGKNEYFLINLNAMEITPMPIERARTIQKILFYPQNSSFLIAHIGNTLYQIETPGYSPIPLLEKIAAFTIHNLTVFAVEEKTNSIISFSLESPLAHSGGRAINEKERIPFNEPLPTKRLTGGFRAFYNTHTLILLDKNVYLWQPDIKKWELVLKDIERMRPFTDKGEYLAWNNNAIWVLGKESNAEKQIFSAKLAARYRNPIVNPFPFGTPPTSLLFGTDNRIEIKELSFDNQENAASLPIETKEFFFDQKTGVLYFIREGNLYQSYLYP